MLRELRDEGPTPRGGSYSVTRWDDETGNADIVEYDSSDEPICRHVWRLLEKESDDGAVGEMVTFDGQGGEVGRGPLRNASPECR